MENSHLLFTTVSENPFGYCHRPAKPTSAANRTSAHSWEHSRGSPGTSRRPGTPLAKLLLLFRLQDLLTSGEGTSPVQSAGPAYRSLYSSLLNLWCNSICILSVSPLPTLSNHFALESLQIFPLQMPSWGMVLSTLKGHLQAWADQASLLGWSLKRDPLNFSTKCLFFHSCHHL